MGVRGRVRLTAIVVAVMLVAGACVYPIPGPGEPVPTLEATVTVDLSGATATVQVTVRELDVNFVQVWPDGLGGPVGPGDREAPWELTVPVGALTPGGHRMVVAAFGDDTVVAEGIDYQLVGCNGSVASCATGYDQVRTVTTHNAMSSSADGWIGPNHHLDVPAQLASGVRGLMLDTYRAGDDNGFGNPQVAGVPPDTGYLCHTLCALGSQPLVEGLVEIGAFLDANPGEVVTLIIESYLDHDLTAGAFAAAGLLDDTYVHPGGAWPTLGALVAADTRLVVLQDRIVDPAHPWLMNVWDHAFETHFDNQVPADFSCAPNRGNPANALFILNHFLTQVFGSPDLAAQVNGEPLIGDRIDQCEGERGATATFVAVDFSTIGDVHTAVAEANAG